MASASASASISASASGTASASGNTLNEARDEATRLANTAAFYSLCPPVHPPVDNHMQGDFVKEYSHNAQTTVIPSHETAINHGLPLECPWNVRL